MQKNLLNPKLSKTLFSAFEFRKKIWITLFYSNRIITVAPAIMITVPKSFFRMSCSLKKK